MQSIFLSIGNAFRKSNNQPIQLIIIACFVFFFKIVVVYLSNFFGSSLLVNKLVNEYMFVSSNPFIAFNHFWTVFIFPFTSSNFLSLLFNCLSLFWFGNLLTDFLGGKKMLSVFYLGAVFSGIFFLTIIGIINVGFNVKPTDVSKIELLYGLSSGVYAILFAAVALLPDYEINLFGAFFVKLKYLALVFLLLSFATFNTGLLSLGASIFGYLYVKLQRQGFSLTQPIEIFFSWFTKPKKKTVFRKTYSNTAVGELLSKDYADSENTPNQEEIDFLLDKISVKGYESLSKDEKHRLFKASQRK